MSSKVRKGASRMRLVFVIFVCVFHGVLSATNCGFSGQCVYNVKVHHCNNTISKRASTGNCDCGDLEIVQGETYNIQSSLSTLESEFNTLMQKYQATIANIKQKKQELETIVAQNKVLESKIQSVDYIQTQTTESVNRQTRNWDNEKARLQELTSKSMKELQSCQATLTSVNSNKGTGVIGISTFVIIRTRVI